jgi:hypothetical protein
MEKTNNTFFPKIKKSIYDVFYYLFYKYNSDPYKDTIIAFIEFFQILSFSINGIVNIIFKYIFSILMIKELILYFGNLQIFSNI